MTRGSLFRRVKILVTWFQSYESYFDFTQFINQSINQLGLGDKIGFLASMIKHCCDVHTDRRTVSA